MLLVPLAVLLLQAPEALPSALEAYYKKVESQPIYCEFTIRETVPGEHYDRRYHQWLQAGKLRYDACKVSSAPFSAQSTVIFDETSGLLIDHVRRSYSYAGQTGIRISPERRRQLIQEQHVPAGHWAFIRPSGPYLASVKYEVTGQAIKRIWQRPRESVQWCQWTLKEGRLLRFTTESPQVGGVHRVELEISKFEVGKEPPPGTFSLTPPQGYRPQMIVWRRPLDASLVGSMIGRSA